MLQVAPGLQMWDTSIWSVLWIHHHLRFQFQLQACHDLGLIDYYITCSQINTQYKSHNIQQQKMCITKCGLSRLTNHMHTHSYQTRCSYYGLDTAHKRLNRISEMTTRPTITFLVIDTLDYKTATGRRRHLTPTTTDRARRLARRLTSPHYSKQTTYHKKHEMYIYNWDDI